MTNNNIINMEDVKNLVDDLIKAAIDDAKEKKEDTFTWETFYDRIDTFIFGFSELQNAINNNLQQTDTKEIIRIGTALLFELRWFLTGETLEFVIGGTSSMTQRGTTTLSLYEKSYDQHTIFKLSGDNNFLVNLSAKEIQFKHELEQLKTLRLKNNVSNLNDYWKDLLKAGFIDKSDTNRQSLGKKSDDEPEMFKKTARDDQVYFYFITYKTKHQDENIAAYNERTNTAMYYRYENKPEWAYNKGWLYQWLNMMKEDELKEIQSSEHPLKIVIQKERRRERIEGITGGDFGTKQFKYYNNPTIITLNNISSISRDILEKLKDIKARPKPDAQAMEQLILLFLNSENKAILKNQLNSLANEFQLKTYLTK